MMKQLEDDHQQQSQEQFYGMGLKKCKKLSFLGLASPA
jgi:hypothetical protein